MDSELSDLPPVQHPHTHVPVVRATAVKPIISVATYACDQCGSEIYQEVRLPVAVSHCHLLHSTACPSPHCGACIARPANTSSTIS